MVFSREEHITQLSSAKWSSMKSFIQEIMSIEDVILKNINVYMHMHIIQMYFFL